MNTTTIRVSTDTHSLLQELSRVSGVSMQIIVERALEQYRRQQVLDAANAAYAALHAQPSAWAEWEQEQAEWEQTLADGLEGV